MLYAEVKRLDPATPVGLPSVASGTLDVVLDPNDPEYEYVSGFIV